MILTLAIITLIIYYYHNKISDNIHRFNNLKTSINKTIDTIKNDTDILSSNKEHLIQTLLDIANKKHPFYKIYTIPKYINTYIETISCYYIAKNISISLKSKETIINTMISDFNLAKKELRILKKKNPTETKKYLVNFNNNLNYYMINHIDKTRTKIEEMNSLLSENKYCECKELYNDIEIIKKSYYLEINAVYYVKGIINDANNNIVRYEHDITKNVGTLFNKIYNKLKKENSTEINKKWNKVKKEITEYISNKDKYNDIVHNSNKLINIIVSLNNIDMLVNQEKKAA